MTVRLTAPYGTQTANTLYTGSDEALLLSQGRADMDLQIAIGYAAYRQTQSGQRQAVDATQPRPLGVIIVGQSQPDSSYPTLTYTPSAFASDGTNKMVTIPSGYSLNPGDGVWAQLTGAVPAAYNDAAFVQYTVGGAFPNQTLVGPSAASGALTTAGTLVVDQKRSYPLGYASAVDPTCAAPLTPKTNSFGGGPAFAMRDRLAATTGRKVSVVQHGIGSISLVKDAVGQVVSWNPNAGYRTRRPASAFDNGCTGEIISVRTSNAWALLECTAGGSQHYMTWQGRDPVPGTSPLVYSPGYAIYQAGGVTGATTPDWTTITAAGQTKVDNAITWTCVAYSYDASTDSAFKLPADSRSYVLQEGQYGFDPNGILARALAQARAYQAQGVTPLVDFFQGESDVGSVTGVPTPAVGLSSPRAASNNWYYFSLMSLAAYFTARGVTVSIGKTYYNTKSSAGNPGYWANYSTAVDMAVAALASNPLVIKGADAYTLFGQTPGSNGLLQQRDNFHANEDIHASAPLSIARGKAQADVFMAAIAAGVIA